MESWFPKLEEKDKDKEKQAERVRGIGTIIEGVLGIFASLSGFIIKLLGFSIFFVTFRVTLDAWLSFFLYPPFLVFQFAKDFTVFFAGWFGFCENVFCCLQDASRRKCRNSCCLCCTLTR